jgi:hypothetical protein
MRCLRILLQSSSSTALLVSASISSQRAVKPGAKSRKMVKEGKLAEHPPFYRNPATGDIIVAGHKTHWTNESTLHLWIDEIVMPAHNKDCEQHRQGPKIASSIVNIACYPVHISKAFQACIKEKHPNLHLISIRTKSTSIAQPADVFLNKPFKNYYSQLHTLHMMQHAKNHLAEHDDLTQFNLSELASALSGPAFKWIAQSYSKLAKLEHKPGLQRIGYTKCWEDEFFVQSAMQRADDFLQGIDVDLNLESEPDNDWEDTVMAGPLLEGF